MNSIVILLATAGTLTSAQITFNTTSNQIICPAMGGNFCAGDSLQSNIIIRCVGTDGYPDNCNDNLAGVPPIGVKGFAPCYQSSLDAGNAACSYGGIAYPDSGAPYYINGTTDPRIGSGQSPNSTVANVPSAAATTAPDRIIPNATAEATQIYARSSSSTSGVSSSTVEGTASSILASSNAAGGIATGVMASSSVAKGVATGSPAIVNTANVESSAAEGAVIGSATGSPAVAEASNTAGGAVAAAVTAPITITTTSYSYALPASMVSGSGVANLMSSPSSSTHSFSVVTPSPSTTASTPSPTLIGGLSIGVSGTPGKVTVAGPTTAEVFKGEAVTASSRMRGCVVGIIAAAAVFVVAF